MSSFSWSPLDNGTGGVPIYASVAAFPVTATQGDLAVDASTGNLYEYNGSSWVQIAGPGAALTLGNLDSQSATAKGAALVSGALSMQSADATHPGLVNNTAQTLSGSKTFSSLLNADGGIDRSTSGTLTIGATNSTIINIGNSGSTVNIQGTTIYENTPHLLVADPLITVNSGGGAGSGQNSGIEVEEAGSITGYNETSSDRNSWILKAPNTAGIATITPGASGITLNQSSHNPVTIGTANGLSLATQALSLALSSTSTTGALSSTDWNTFNGKQAAGNYITALTGDGTASGPGSVALTLATVNSNVGSFGSVTQVGTFTVNSKGLITAASNASIQIAESQVTNLVSDLAGKQATGNYITALTGEGTATGPGSVALTLSNSAVIAKVLTGFTAGAGTVSSSDSILSAFQKLAGNDGLYLPLAGGTMTGAVNFAAGLVGTPSVYFAGDNTSGFYRSAANEVSYSALGSKIVSFNGVGVVANAAVTTSSFFRGSNLTGGISSGSTLTLQSTQGTGTTGADIIFKVGANGATEVGRFKNDGTALFNSSVTATGGFIGNVTGNASGTALNVTGTVAIANGGTGQTSQSTAFNALSPMTTGGDLIYGGASGAGTRLANGSAGQVLTSSGGTSAPTWTSVTAVSAPATVQTFASGSGTYNKNYTFIISSGSATVGATYTNNAVTYTVYRTVSSAIQVVMSGSGAPASSGTLTKASGTGDSTLTFSQVLAPLYLKVTAVGGGSGGKGSSLTANNNAGVSNAGGQTSFGSTLLVANGGAAVPAGGSQNAGAGGSATLGTDVFGFTLVGGRGTAGGAIGSSPGGGGGSNPMGGAGGGSVNGVAGYDAAVNSGGGGGGAGSPGSAYSGEGGGAGGYASGTIYSPAATYAYVVGAGGGGGAGGTGGNAGGAGGSGIIIVEEHYQ